MTNDAVSAAGPAADLYSSDIQKVARTKDGVYDKIMSTLTKCPFCDLKPKYFIAKREQCVLTVNLFPYIDGHLMIVPKAHHEKFELLSMAEWCEIFELIKVGKTRLTEVLGVKSFNVLYREGVQSGSSLGHLHVHLIPMEPSVISRSFVELQLAPIEVAERLRIED